MILTYEDTYEACKDCGSGTYVIYHDGVIRCRYCGQIKPQPPKKAVAGKKTNG